jgi:hypothetical protein
LPILLPHVSELIYMRVLTDHVEIGVDGQDMVSSKEIKARLNCLTLKLILEKVTLPVDEINCIFKLQLL